MLVSEQIVLLTLVQRILIWIVLPSNPFSENFD